jgi:hypothetical protein
MLCIRKDKIAIKVGLFVLFLKQILISGKDPRPALQETETTTRSLSGVRKSALGGSHRSGNSRAVCIRRKMLQKEGLFSVFTWVQKMTKLYPDSMIEEG